MSNKRVFWACSAVAFCTHGLQLTAGPGGTVGCLPAYGVQSVGITTNFNLEQVFELGQIAIYENVEEVPDIEVTIEKVLDGEPLIYDLATLGGTGAVVNMTNRANDRKDVWFTIQDETTNFVEDIGTNVYMSGMYVSSFSYTLPNEGNCTESVTLVGNDKLWKTGIGAIDADELDDHVMGANGWGALDFGASPGQDTPGHVTGVQRRENVVLASSKIPTDIWGVTTNNVGGANNANTHLVSITMSADLGREAINELGTKLPYYRYVTYPIEVSCDIEVTTVSGDLVDASSKYDNLANQAIYVVLSDTTIFDLGTINKLSSVTYTGGSTGGENATVTYSYQGFNEFQVNGPA